MAKMKKIMEIVTSKKAYAEGGFYLFFIRRQKICSVKGQF